MSAGRDTDRLTRARRTVLRWFIPVAMSVVLVAATTAVLWQLEVRMQPDHLIFIYLAPAAWIAIRYGAAMAIGAILACSAAAAYFLYPPHNSFLVGSALDLFEMVMFGMLAILASQVVSGFANDRRVVRRRL